MEISKTLVEENATLILDTSIVLFLFLRYTQPPVDLWDWYEGYLDDEEELDVKAGGGQMMSIGEMLRHFLSKLEWFSTLFPRIPVPIQKDLEKKLSNWRAAPKNKALNVASEQEWTEDPEQQSLEEEQWNEDQPTESSSQDQDTKHRSSRDSFKEAKDKLDVAEEIAREKERQRRDKERHGSATKSHHHTSERHKDHIGHSSSRVRSRSPVRNFEAKPHRDRDVERHKDKHRDKDRELDRSRHRGHEHSREKSHRKEAVDREKEYRSSKDKLHNHERKDLDRRRSRSHSHDYEKRHEKHSRSRGRDRH